jgi:NAD(P)-dependent dehydrogenase (short-subunit alcohol dehydrogenase family)
MIIQDQVVVVTGAANGIGEGMARRFARLGAKGILVADLDGDRVMRLADEIGAVGMRVDVRSESEIGHMIARARQEFGEIDLLCSNAGVSRKGGIEVPDADWACIMEVNFYAHLYAARAVIPAWTARGKGYFLNTISAAGLLTQIGSAPYAVTKHAALAFAEWLSVQYGDQGIKVSALCPQGVRTNMLLGEPGHFLLEGSLSVEQVVDAVIAGLDKEEFLILPHPEVKEYFRRKADDYDRWLRGMRRLQARVLAQGG